MSEHDEWHPEDAEDEVAETPEPGTDGPVTETVGPVGPATESEGE
jgi:hypothetical protein